MEMLNIFDFNIPFFYRYLVMAILSSKIDEKLIKFNLFYPRIQFTIEISGRKINFLDMIIVDNSYIKFNIYHKHIFSGKS